MANQDAVMRAAKADMPMGGMPTKTPPDMGGMPQEGPKAAPPDSGGVDAVVKGLEGVGAFLQAQGPKGEEAMGHYQALLQSMANLGGENPNTGGKVDLETAPPTPGRVHESKFPGVQVL